MKTVSLCLCLAFLGLLAGCGGGGSSNLGGQASPVLQSLAITPPNPSVAAGRTVQFTAMGKYSDGSSKDLTRSAVWSSSNTNAVKISGSGLATTKTVGSLIITATSGTVSGTTTLNVTAAVLVSVAVAPQSPSAAAGVNDQFTATGVFSDGSTENLTTSVNWSSSNPAVATISSMGVAMGKMAGSTTIMAVSGNVSGISTFSVTAAALESIAVTPLSSSIAQGTTQQFVAIGTFTDGSTQNLTALVNWTSSSAAVATVSNSPAMQGLAKGLAAGNATITATSGTISSIARLTVTQTVVTSIAVTPANGSIPLGTLQQFTATGTFSNGTTQDITNVVTWNSSAPKLASITVSGLVTARSLCTQPCNQTMVTITAAFGGVSGSTPLNINSANLVSIAIVPDSATIAETTSEQFEAIGTFNDGGTRPLTGQVSWSSSNTAVATIGVSTGRAVGLAGPGMTTITATLGSITASATLDVTSASLVSISVVPSSQSIAPGTKLSFTATGSFSDSSTQIITQDVSWVSSNQSMATVGNTSGSKGVATGGSVSGTTRISATLNGITGSAPLNVSSAQLVSIALSPASAVVAPGSTLGYVAIGTFSDHSTQGISSAVTWNSSTISASIDSNGVVTGESAGTAIITAQLGAVVGSAQLVVESSPLVSIAILPASASLAEQTSTQFTATGTFADGSTQKLTNSVIWTSSPSSLAVVSNIPGTIGLATGIAPGTSTIAALFDGQVATALLTVTNAALTSITISPASGDIALGSSQLFVATGNFSDSTTQNLTNQAIWSSSNPGVATINAGGVANSAATGTTTIRATMNGVSGTAVLNVH